MSDGWFQGLVGLGSLALIAFMVKDVLSKNTNGAAVTSTTETNVVDFFKTLNAG